MSKLPFSAYNNKVVTSWHHYLLGHGHFEGLQTAPAYQWLSKLYHQLQTIIATQTIMDNCSYTAHRGQPHSYNPSRATIVIRLIIGNHSYMAHPSHTAHHRQPQLYGPLWATIVIWPIIGNHSHMPIMGNHQHKAHSRNHSSKAH